MSIRRMMLAADEGIFRENTSPCATSTKQVSHGVTWYQPWLNKLECPLIAAHALARPQYKDTFAFLINKFYLRHSKFHS